MALAIDIKRFEKRLNLSFRLNLDGERFSRMEGKFGGKRESLFIKEAKPHWASHAREVEIYRMDSRVNDQSEACGFFVRKCLGDTQCHSLSI